MHFPKLIWPRISLDYYQYPHLVNEGWDSKRLNLALPHVGSEWERGSEFEPRWSYARTYTLKTILEFIFSYQVIFELLGLNTTSGLMGCGGEGSSATELNNLSLPFIRGCEQGSSRRSWGSSWFIDWHVQPTAETDSQNRATGQSQD